MGVVYQRANTLNTIMKKNCYDEKEGVATHMELVFDGAATGGGLNNHHVDSGIELADGQDSKIELAGYGIKWTLAAALHVLEEGWSDYMKLLDLFFNAKNNGCGIADICPPWKNKYGVWMMLYARNKSDDLDLEAYLALAASLGLQVGE